MIRTYYQTVCGWDLDYRINEERLRMGEEHNVSYGTIGINGLLLGYEDGRFDAAYRPQAEFCYKVIRTSRKGRVVGHLIGHTIDELASITKMTPELLRTKVDDFRRSMNHSLFINKVYSEFMRL